MASARLPYDAVVIGGGHNGLVAAAYLAKAGRRTLVLERRDHVGGAATTSELAPGFRVPTLAHTVGRMRPFVVRDLRLRDLSVDLVEPDVRAFLPLPDGRAVTLWADHARTAEEIRQAFGPAEAGGWRELDRLVGRLGRVMAELGAVIPPDPKAIGFSDALVGLRLLRAYRGLRRADRDALLRVLPMPVADTVAEHLTADPLQAAVAFRAVLYSRLGPMSAGTTATLLADSDAGGGAAGRTVFARGGPGALSEALAAAARGFGAEVRTGAAAARILSRDGRAEGVALSSGEGIAAKVVVSAIDPKHTFLDLVDPVELGPHLRWRVSNYRMTGCVAKVNLALSALPTFPTLADAPDGAARLSGRIVVADSVMALERAFDECRAGRIPSSPPLQVTIPSLADRSLIEPTLAPETGQVMSVLVQYVPFDLAEGDWDACRDALGDTVLRRLEGIAPGISGLVVARQVVTPTDLERDFGLTGGHPLHGEPSLDQWFAWRPLLELGRYRTPIAGLYLGGSGSHPGGGITGAPGANAARAIESDL
jgi:phytoene dehydrogenase-like protein